MNVDRERHISVPHGWVMVGDPWPEQGDGRYLGKPPPQLVTEVQQAAGSLDGVLSLAARCGSWAPLPGSGGTAQRWELLATLAAQDVSVARVVEAHMDAVAILAEAQVDAADLNAVRADENSTWGVFAAEASGVRVLATAGQGGWSLTGVKPWCSLADRLSHALITAHTPEGNRRLFAVALQDGTVLRTGQRWIARGLRHVPSTAIQLTSTPAVPVGADRWYLTRPGFTWGGAGVAACWYGGAVGVARALLDIVGGRVPDQIAQMHLGGVDVALSGVRCVLSAAARQIDGGAADGENGAVMAHRVRAAAASAAEDVLIRAGHSLGPAPLALDEAHAGRVADLQMYIRQHHAERDLAALGRAVQVGGAPW